MNDIKIFENPQFGEIRTMAQDGEPWFVGKDVAELLGYVKPQNAIAAHVDDEDKTLAPIQGGCSTRTVPIVRFDGKPDVRRETLWTMRGHRFIRDLMTKTEEV